MQQMPLFFSDFNMPPTEKNSKKKRLSFFEKVNCLRKEYIRKDLIMDLIVNPKYFWLSAIVFLMAEMIVSILIIQAVKCKFGYDRI